MIDRRPDPSSALAALTLRRSGTVGPLLRRVDWPERLHTHIEAARGRPFEWGAHDCVRFACGAVEAMTGTNPLPFAYRNRIEGLAFLRRFAAAGFEAGVETVMTRLEAPEIEPARARRGDVALVRIGSTDALGVCVGRRLAVPERCRGVAWVSRRQARRAWRIG